MAEKFNQFIALLIDKSLALLILLVTYLVMEKIIFKYIKIFYKKRIKQRQIIDQRAETLYKLIISCLHYILYFFIGYSALTILGFPMATLIAGAGIAGLVIGLGAQGFINDLVNGVFILIEHQFDVNDSVIISGIEGKVKSIGLRITTLVGHDGSLYYLRNKDISAVNNLSKGTRKGIIRLFVQDMDNLQKVESIIQQINQHDISSYPEIIREPEYIGFQVNNYGKLFYSVALYTTPDALQMIKKLFSQKYINALAENQINVIIKND